VEEPATRHVRTRHLRRRRHFFARIRAATAPAAAATSAPSTSTAHARAVCSIWRHFWHGAASATATDAAVGQSQPDEPVARHECSHDSTLWRRAATIPAADATTEWSASATLWHGRGSTHAT